MSNLRPAGHLWPAKSSVLSSLQFSNSSCFVIKNLIYIYLFKNAFTAYRLKSFTFYMLHIGKTMVYTLIVFLFFVTQTGLRKISKTRKTDEDMGTVSFYTFRLWFFVVFNYFFLKAGLVRFKILDLSKD